MPWDGEIRGNKIFQDGRWQPLGAGGTPPPPPPPAGTGYFSTVDRHELSEDELWNSNVVVGSDGFVYSTEITSTPNILTGKTEDSLSFGLAPQWMQEQVLGAGFGEGATGPSAAELAIERSKVQATNLASFLDATIAGISADIDARRLTSEQAIGEFNRRLDAFEAAGTEFRGIQPYTIPQGAEYIPGFGPEGPATRVGLQPVKASPTMYDPFGMAADIVATTPNIAAIGAPSTSALQQAIEMARRFI